MRLARIIARPYGGLNLKLNRHEYLLAHAFQGVLEGAASSINVHELTVADAMGDFDNRIKILTGPAFQQLLHHYNRQTATEGVQVAHHLLIQRGITPRHIAAKAKARPKYTPPPPPGGTSVPPKLIDRVTDFTIENLDRITSDLKDRLSTTLKEGLANEETYRDITTRVQDALSVDTNRAKERARTLTVETYTQAQVFTYKQAGAPGLEYLAAEDEKTCDICGDLDGTIWDIDDPDLIRPPVHNDCRCTLLPYVHELPDDAGQVSDATREFCQNWRENYFNIPQYTED
jgi:SPP1 gp7 family putative phage head morphogenesis protein